jgi:hypothetical protein
MSFLIMVINEGKKPGFVKKGEKGADRSMLAV